MKLCQTYWFVCFGCVSARQVILITKNEASDMMTVVLDSALELNVDLVAELTSKFVSPRCFFEEKYVVCQGDDVKDLIGEENVPAFDLVRRVVECNHRVGQLRYDVEDASRHSNSTDCVDRATAV